MLPLALYSGPPFRPRGLYSSPGLFVFFASSGFKEWLRRSPRQTNATISLIQRHLDQRQRPQISKQANAYITSLRRSEDLDIGAFIFFV